MKKINLLFLFLISTTYGICQPENPMQPRMIEQHRAKHFMVGIAFDVLKSDFGDRVGNKLQGGIELNYFFVERISATAGLEVWTEEGKTYSGVAGFRYYPLRNIFVRGRLLVGVDDISVGAGFHKLFNQRWSAEGMLDYYVEGDVGLRLGMTFLLTEKMYREQ